jgi:hypothetical protein
MSSETNMSSEGNIEDLFQGEQHSINNPKDYEFGDVFNRGAYESDSETTVGSQPIDYSINDNSTKVKEILNLSEKLDDVIKDADQNNIELLRNMYEKIINIKNKVSNFLQSCPSPGAQIKELTELIRQKDNDLKNLQNLPSEKLNAVVSEYNQLKKQNDDKLQQNNIEKEELNRQINEINVKKVENTRRLEKTNKLLNETQQKFQDLINEKRKLIENDVIKENLSNLDEFEDGIRNLNDNKPKGNFRQLEQDEELIKESQDNINQVSDIVSEEKEKEEKDYNAIINDNYNKFINFVDDYILGDSSIDDKVIAGSDYTNKGLLSLLKNEDLFKKIARSSSELENNIPRGITISSIINALKNISDKINNSENFISNNKDYWLTHIPNNILTFANYYKNNKQTMSDNDRSIIEPIYNIINSGLNPEVVGERINIDKPFERGRSSDFQNALKIAMENKGKK